jgi:hypothetical protein
MKKIHMAGRNEIPMYSILIQKSIWPRVWLESSKEYAIPQIVTQNITAANHFTTVVAPCKMRKAINKVPTPDMRSRTENALK